MVFWILGSKEQIWGNALTGPRDYVPARNQTKTGKSKEGKRKIYEEESDKIDSANV